MFRRVAGLDLGSNSFLLLILDKGPGGERVVLDRTDIVGLSEGVDRTGRLCPVACQRGLATLDEYATLCRQHEVERCKAVGTAVFRDAADRDVLIEAARARCGIDIEVLDGEREAALTYQDVATTHGRPGQPLILFDIGGGSSEVVRGRDGRIESAVSINIGSRRLTERWGPSADPPSAADLQRLRELAATAVEGLAPAGGTVVGTGGTITTLVAVKLAMVDYDPATVNVTPLSLDEVTALVERFAAVPLESRRRIPGLPPKRAGVILAGTCLLAQSMRRLEVDNIGVSAGGLRYALARQAWQELQR